MRIDIVVLWPAVRQQKTSVSELDEKSAPRAIAYHRRATPSIE